MFSKFLNLFIAIFRSKVTSRIYFPMYMFPVIDITPSYRKISRGFISSKRNPRTPQKAFINGIPVFTKEEEAFDYWKKTYYPDAEVNTLTEYKKNWRKFRYQVWGVRVLNVHKTSKYLHDPNFPVVYFVVDSHRKPESNRLSDDIRHYYIKYVYTIASKATIYKWDFEHKILANNPNANWQQNVCPTRRTVK